MSLRRVSALEGPSSGMTTGTFQQQGQHNELRNVQFSLVNYRVNMLRAEHDTELYICCLFVDLAVVMCLS